MDTDIHADQANVSTAITQHLIEQNMDGWLEVLGRSAVQSKLRVILAWHDAASEPTRLKPLCFQGQVQNTARPCHMSLYSSSAQRSPSPMHSLRLEDGHRMDRLASTQRIQKPSMARCEALRFTLLEACCILHANSDSSDYQLRGVLSRSPVEANPTPTGFVWRFPLSHQQS